MSTQGDKPPRSSLLPSERAALGQPSLTTGRLAEDGGASLADDDGLGVREDGGDGEAAGALDVHEEGSRGGDEGLAINVRSIVEHVNNFVFLVAYRTLSLCFLASLAAEGFRRSTARTWEAESQPNHSIIVFAHPDCRLHRRRSRSRVPSF